MKSFKMLLFYCTLLRSSQMFRLLLISCILFSKISFAGTHSDTVSVYFDLNKVNVTESAKSKIDSVMRDGYINPGSSLLIVGYADYIGLEGANHLLSEKRAKNVLAYLTEKGINKDSVKSCVGKGEINRVPNDNVGYPKDRKVDIIVIRKGLTNLQGSRTNYATNDNRNVQNLILNTPIGEAVALNVFFYPSRHKVKEESMPVLEQLFAVLNANPKIKIKIEGHICCADTSKMKDSYDLDVLESERNRGNPQGMEYLYVRNTLSLNRAHAIYVYLAKKGIDTHRMSIEGYGHTRPLVVNETTSEDKAKNMRVEVRIVDR